MTMASLADRLGMIEEHRAVERGCVRGCADGEHAVGAGAGGGCGTCAGARAVRGTEGSCGWTRGRWGVLWTTTVLSALGTWAAVRKLEVYGQDGRQVPCAWR
jgi:hypothetical protein